MQLDPGGRAGRPLRRVLRGGAPARPARRRRAALAPQVRTQAQDAAQVSTIPILQRATPAEGDEVSFTHWVVGVAVGRFISKDLAAKILVIGKSINFMRRCCKDKEW